MPPPRLPGVDLLRLVTGVLVQCQVIVWRDIPGAALQFSRQPPSDSADSRVPGMAPAATGVLMLHMPSNMAA